MAWIDVIEESEATGKLKEVYEKIKGKRGKVANILKVQSLNPRALEAHLEFYVSILFGRSTFKT